MQFFSDYMDEACQFKVGHTNWAFSHNVIDIKLEGNNNPEVDSVVIIYKEDDKEEDDKL